MQKDKNILMYSYKNKRKILAERLVISSGRSNKEIKRIKRFNTFTASVFVTVPILVLTIFVFAAFAIGVWLSFYAGRLSPSLKGLRFVGLDNWKLLIQNPLVNRWMIIAIKNTLIFASITTACNIVGALIISSILNSKLIKNKNAFMAIYFFPQLTSAIASAIIFFRLGEVLFDFNYVLDGSAALWMVIIASVWGGISGGMITFNTAFSGIGASQYEASLIDGASPLRQFFSITIPSLGPILAYTLITSLIGGMGIFDSVFLFAANGAPPEGYMTWALYGFGFLQEVKGFPIRVARVGLGMVVLMTLGITIFITTRIANIIKPMDRS